MQKLHQSNSPVQLTNKCALLHERFPTKAGRIQTHVIDRLHPIGQQWCEKCDACAQAAVFRHKTTKVEVRQAAEALVTLLSLFSCRLIYSTSHRFQVDIKKYSPA